MKQCTKCNNLKSLDDFHKNKSRKDGYCGRCISCVKTKQADWYIKNREKRKIFYNENKLILLDKMKKRYHVNPKKLNKLTARKRKLKYKYNISLEEFNQMVIKQNNQCAICFKLEGTRLCIDHNHNTNKIRGLLCRSCNLGIGYLKTDNSIQLLENAIEYIKSQNV